MNHFQLVLVALILGAIFDTINSTGNESLNELWD